MYGVRKFFRRVIYESITGECSGKYGNCLKLAYNYFELLNTAIKHKYSGIKAVFWRLPHRKFWLSTTLGYQISGGTVLRQPDIAKKS